MRKISIIVVLLFLFVVTLTSFVYANFESQEHVNLGRMFLFNNGNPTYSGIINADSEFQLAVAADASDQEANLFYAVTRIAVFALENGSGPGLETLGDLYEAFGLTENTNDSLHDLPVDPPLLLGKYDPPYIVPDGESVRAFLSGPVVDFCDVALANLSTITDTFTTTITAVETGLTAVELDYGDVLILKSALYTLKGLCLFTSAYDLSIDIKNIIIKGNMNVLKIQRDLLDQYPNLLSLRISDGATSLSAAQQAFIYGIDAYRDAFDFITGESDFQDDDFFFFGSKEEENEANHVLTEITEIENSIIDNSPATFTYYDERWILTNQDGKRLYMAIDKDQAGVVYDGWAWGIDGCDFLFCYGDVIDFSVSGNTATITMMSDWWCGEIMATLTGTLSVPGDQITGGSYQWTDCSGTPINGTFTAVRQSTETNDSLTMDFNYIFGNTGKSPMDIRTVLPDFGLRDEIIPNTFPGSPVLNDIFPEYQTNDDLTKELELQPYGFFNISTVADGGISIDGSSSDWPGNSLVFTDLINDEDPYADFSGMDIEKFYMVKDSTYLYAAIKLYDNDPLATDNAGYVFQANQSFESSCTPGDRIDGVLYHSGWSSNVSERIWPCYATPTLIGSYPGSYVGAGSKFIEWKVPLADMGDLSGKFVQVYSHYMGGYPSSDFNTTHIMLDTASVSGQVTSSIPGSTSNISVWAYDGPDPNIANILGKTVIQGPGSYTIEGLPIGGNVYLYALLDVDNNGIKTAADYSSLMVGPSIVLSGATAVNLIVGTSLDSDGDGIRDDIEISSGTNPNDADTDDDGIIDGDEDLNQNGVVDAGETDPFNVDTDGDGLQDGTELGYTTVHDSDTNTEIFQPDLDDTTTTDPLDEDSDNDGAVDGIEDTNHDGKVDPGETDPSVFNPIIDSIVPFSESEGIQITINGSSFGEIQGSSYVTFFDGVEATDIVSWSDIQIVCTVPSGAETGCVRVTTDNGDSNCFPFIVINIPCSGDLNSDGDVDGSDLDMFSDAYNMGDLAADLDNSGVVNIDDLDAFAESFGRDDCPILP